MADSPKKRPLVASGILTEFGELQDDPEQYMAEGTTAPDLTYVPGFSELRAKRDSELALVAQGKMAPQDVTTLPVNIRHSRRTQKNGTPDQTKLVAAGHNGYRPLTKKDINPEWFKEIPPGCTELPDGSIARGDVQLMICDGQRAARNSYRKQQKTMARLGQAAFAPGKNLPGLTVSTTKGQPFEAGSAIKTD